MKYTKHQDLCVSKYSEFYYYRISELNENDTDFFGDKVKVEKIRMGPDCLEYSRTSLKNALESTADMEVRIITKKEWEEALQKFKSKAIRIE